MRIAIAHHWFVSRGGGERVAETLANIFPEADLFSLVVDKRTLPSSLSHRHIRTSVLQRIPKAKKIHRHLLPFYPFAVEQLDLTKYDLVISSDSGPIKGVLTNPQAVHLCYCHSPMRYLWDGYHAYISSMPGLASAAFSLAAHYVRNWDYIAAQRVDHFIANSNYVANRIRRFYSRSSTVIHPPIDTAKGFLAEQTGSYYLTVGRLVAYKQTDLLIQACNRLKRPLRIIGTGPEYKRLRQLAGPTVQFLGEVSDIELWENYAHCRAFLFAADEDFGMVPLEAQSCGRPVIAYGKGGSLETVCGIEEDRLSDQEPTGVFFGMQSIESLIDAILLFEKFEDSFSPQLVQRHARQFDTKHFVAQIQGLVHQFMPGLPKTNNHSDSTSSQKQPLEIAPDRTRKRRAG